MLNALDSNRYLEACKEGGEKVGGVGEKGGEKAGGVWEGVVR